MDKALVQVSPTGRYTMLQTIANSLASGWRSLANSTRSLPATRQHSPPSQTRFAEESSRTARSLRYSAASPRSRTSPSPSTHCSPRREREMWRQPRRVCACAETRHDWHVRGKNLTAREISKRLPGSERWLGVGERTAAAMRTAALGVWALGQIETANQEWHTACDLARSADDAVELCICAMLSVFGLIGVDGVLGGACHGGSRSCPEDRLSVG